MVSLNAIRDWLQPILNGMLANIGAGQNFIKDTLLGAIPGVDGIPELVATALQPAFNTIASSFTTLTQHVTNVVNVVLDRVREVYELAEDIYDVVDDIAGQITDYLFQIYEWVRDIPQYLLDLAVGLMNLIVQLSATLQSLMTAQYSQLQTLVLKGGQVGLQMAEQVAEAGKEVITITTSNTGAFIKSGLDTLRIAIGALANDILKLIENQSEFIIGFVSGLTREVASTGARFVTEIAILKGLIGAFGLVGSFGAYRIAGAMTEL